MTNPVIHPVDERLPAGRLFALGLQHVLVMYAGAIAVPLIIGGALKLPKEQIAFLINADLFCCGIVTLVQSFGIWRFGIRMPVMMGVTFAAVGPMLAMAGNPQIGILGIYGSVIAAGIFGIVVAPVMSSLVRYFPPVVTGTIITVIGISLMRVGINWAAGGQPTIRQVVDGVSREVPNPAYGAPDNLAIALVVLVAILLITRYARGFIANIAVLLGLLIGFAVALLFGKVSFSGLAEAKWFDVVMPLQFGMPVFDPGAIIAMCLVMIVVMVESTGMFLALSDITGKRLSNAELADGLRTDGLGTLIGGIFNTFPYTSFSQNVGLVGVTGVRSRWVCVAAGLILVAFGLFPKMAHVAASIPQFVLGGAGVVMFGMVAATGIKILSTVDFAGNRYNLFIVAVSIGSGMIPLVAPTFFAQMPKVLSPILYSGILIASIMAVLLNAFFNGARSADDAKRDAAAIAHGAEP
jgi:NCS2 family nucleobase:cation symporter-2